MEENEPGRASIQSVERVFAVLEALYSYDGLGVSQLAEELDIAKSTAHRYLSTLEEIEYVFKENEEYRLGFGFLRFGEHTKYRNQYYRLAEEKTKELARETGERAQFVVEEYGYAIYVHTHQGENAIQVALPVKLSHADQRSVIGKCLPLHCTSAGKAILAELPDDAVREIIDARGLSPVTENTITTPVELFDDLQRIRERGYSTNDEEGTSGLRAIGVSVTDSGGSPVGAISVAGPTHRMKGQYFETELPDLLLGVVNEIELENRYL